MAEEGGDDGLVCAYRRTLERRWSEVGWGEVRSWKPEHGLLWVHLDREKASSRDYLQRCAGIDAIVHEALLAEETRPRALSISQGLLLILRGVNLNPGADPEDMVSLRLWAEPERLTTTRHHRIMAIDGLRERLSGSRPPETMGDLVVQLAPRLVERMPGVIERLGDEEDALEELIVEEVRREIRSVLARIRRQALTLRRHLAPQPDDDGVWVKILFREDDHRVVGATLAGHDQCLGKRCDILATAVTAGMAVQDVADLDLSYSPPFFPVWDPVLQPANKARFALSGG